MSLASAQRKLFQKQQKLLTSQGEGKMGSKLFQQAGSIMGAIVMPAMEEKFNISKNKRDWDSFESGKEYAGLEDKSDKPTWFQKRFKNPSDVLKDKQYNVGKDRTISTHKLKMLGRLNQSENLSYYEQASKEQGGLLNAYSSAIPKENESFAPVMQDKSGLDYSKVPGFDELGLDPHSNHKGMGNEPNQMPLPENTEGGKAPLYSDYDQIQNVVQKGMDANKVDGEYSFDSARSNYYKQMNERNEGAENTQMISKEAGASYWDELIKKRNELKPSEKSIE